MKITPTSLTISQLLSSNKEQFVVPAYQRRYSWQVKHVAELYDDITHLEIGETHLLGSIVCLTTSLVAGINTLELVDGQQRTTTIMLVLNAIEEKYKSMGEEKEAEKLEGYLTCTDFDRSQKNKLVLGDLDETDFTKIMSGKKLDEVENRHLLEAHKLIYSLLDKLGVEELDIFKDKFINQANVIRLDVAEAKDAFKLFETINNRGLSLSPADIIKNFLLGNASTIDDETLEDVKQDWTQLIKNMDGLNLDDFFRQYMNGLLGRKVSFTGLIDSFKKYYVDNVRNGDTLTGMTEYSPEVTDTILREELSVSDEEETVVIDVAHPSPQQETISITEFVERLRKASDTYSKILNARFGDTKVDRHMINLQKIRSFASYTFVLNLMQRDIDRKEKFEILRLLEIFMLRRNIAEYRTAELDDIFSSLTAIPDENIVETVKTTLRAYLPNDAEFEEKLFMHDFRGRFENRAKYILETIEDHITGNTGEKYISDGEDVHLEHIMPQTITTKKAKEEYGDWERYLGDEVDLHKTMV
ncbi:MAG TPA: DUF262 domain-containing protein, partial [Candidatus Saccharimonadia bacterium]